MSELESVRTLSAMVRDFPNVVTEQRLRHQLRERHNNGLAASGAISKRGGLWLFLPGKYFAWLFDEKVAA